MHLNFYAFNNVEAVVAPSDPQALVGLIDGIFEAVLTSVFPRSDDWYENWRFSKVSDYRVHVEDYFAKAADLYRTGPIFDTRPTA